MTLLRLLCLAFLFASVGVSASDGYTVNPSTYSDITAHSTCKRVTNAAANSVYVPTTYAGEWSSFYTYPPAGVTIANCGCTVTAGSQSFTTAGSHSFTVPCHNNLTVTVWGGGGGGGSGYMSGTGPGQTGGQSTWNTSTMTANGGVGGIGGSASGGQGSAGGTASGGSTNTNGNAGTNAAASAGGNGGSSPNGGSGGVGSTAFPSVGQAGTAPGGGGAGGGAFYDGGGGGGGGYATATYAAGTYSVGASVPVTVGAAGAGGLSGNPSYNGGAGAVGRVTVSWN